MGTQAPVLFDTAEASRLRALLRELAALSAIPAVWIEREHERVRGARDGATPAVASALADALAGLLELDFVFVRLRDPGGAGAADTTRGDAWNRFPEWLERHLAAGRLPQKEIASAVGGGLEPCRGFAIPIGLDGEAGLLAAASTRVDFPTPLDQLLLALAATQADAAFQSARLIHERRRAEDELRDARDHLEVKVAERTAALRRSEAYLAEAQRLTHTGSFAVTVSKKQTHSSDEHSRLFGFDPRQGILSFADLLDRVHPDDRATWVEAFERAIGEGTGFAVEYRVVRPHGPVRHLQAIGHPVFNSSGELDEVVGTVMDVSERKQMEEERRAQLWFFESMDGVNRAIQRTSDLEQMLGAVLDVVVALFDCDRAWLLHPCDPDADVHRVCTERARPGHAGAFGRAVEIANDPELAAVIRTVLDSSHPVRFDPKSARALRPAATERYGIRSMLAAAVYPKMDAPYLFGLYQCSHARVWTPAEERLFQAIGRRLADALDRLSMFRDLRESERKLERSRAELTASRARVLAAGDDARRRIQRDLHDGAQQRLVQTVVTLKLARRALGDGPSPAVDLVEEALSHAARANGELRELAHGILPAALVNGGLRAGIAALVSRTHLPVDADVTAERLPAPLEAAAYFIIAEALTNTVKHARASHARIVAAVDGSELRLAVSDDGKGGAHSGASPGMLGLRDRAAALNGELHIESPPGEGTLVAATLPIPE